MVELNFRLLLKITLLEFRNAFSSEKAARMIRLAVKWWNNFDDMFNRFDTIPECDDQADACLEVL